MTTERLTLISHSGTGRCYLTDTKATAYKFAYYWGAKIEKSFLGFWFVYV